MLIQDLNNAFNNALFYKAGMIQNGLDCHFGCYDNKVIEETNSYFIVEMTPKPFAKKLKRTKVIFGFTNSFEKGLKKICDIKVVK